MFAIREGISAHPVFSNMCTLWYNLHNIYKNCYMFRHPGDRRCALDRVLWRMRLTIVTVETQQCAPCVLLSYMPLWPI